MENLFQKSTLTPRSPPTKKNVTHSRGINSNVPPSQNMPGTSTEKPGTSTEKPKNRSPSLLMGMDMDMRTRLGRKNSDGKGAITLTPISAKDNKRNAKSEDKIGGEDSTTSEVSYMVDLTDAEDGDVESESDTLTPGASRKDEDREVFKTPITTLERRPLKGSNRRKSPITIDKIMNTDWRDVYKGYDTQLKNIIRGPLSTNPEVTKLMTKMRQAVEYLHSKSKRLEERCQEENLRATWDLPPIAQVEVGTQTPMARKSNMDSGNIEATAAKRKEVSPAVNESIKKRRTKENVTYANITKKQTTDKKITMRKDLSEYFLETEEDNQETASNGEWHEVKGRRKYSVQGARSRANIASDNRLTSEDDKRRKPEMPGRNGRRRKVSKFKNDAIVIRKKSSEENFKLIYKDVLEKAKEHLANCDIKRIRSTRAGDLLIEAPKGAASENFKNLIDTIKIDREINELQPKILIEIKDIDPMVSTEDCLREIKTKLDIDLNEIRLRFIRTAYAGMLRLMADVPAKCIAEINRDPVIRIGLVRTKIKIDEMRQRCNKCLDFGHVGSRCTSNIDIQGKCIKCGMEGHHIKSCTQAPKCVICRQLFNEDEVDVGHIAGSRTCLINRKRIPFRNIIDIRPNNG